MSDEYNDDDELYGLNPGEEEDNGEAVEGGFGSMLVDLTDDTVRHQLRGMFQSWYLDYASYTILDRAIPHIDDGLKPVQRRILHTMKKLDDEHFIKVANIVGATMAFHPHGDSSIYGALVQLGQKQLLVDTQGNWGNTLTGASAAAGRYIEARLSPFAVEVLYNPKVTEWVPSYDGRDKEPVTLPAKFPLLLFQGVGGIAVGLSSLIMPHNFNEILDAAVAYLKNEPFTLYPDFPTGGFIDVSRYNDGARGGRIKVRAKIEKIDSKTLAITEIPFGLTTETLIETIIKANDKGKIKIRRVDDNTSRTARIIVTLQPGTSSDKAIDALYAFTSCELQLSPNCCVIHDDKPRFLGVSDVLRHNVDHTRAIFKAELEIKLGEVREQLLFATLEKIFIEERIYKDKEFEESRSKTEAIRHIDRRLEPWKEKFIRPLTDDDLLRLLEIKMSRILRFSSDAADDAIAEYNRRIEAIEKDLASLTEYTIRWFEHLKEKYGAAYPRQTVIRNFDSIEAANVAEATEKLYIDRDEGFIGTALKIDPDKREKAFLFNCSNIDDIIVFYRDGKYKVMRVQEKVSVGKGIIHVGLFKRNDIRTVYNVIYQDGRGGTYYMKRFSVTGMTRDKIYDLTQGKPGSKVAWFTANSNGEAESVKVVLKPKARLKTLQFDVDFAELAIKGRGAMGNIVTKNEVHHFTLSRKGHSTLGGRQVWFDHDVLRINYDGRGEYLGEFGPSDLVLVVLDNGEFYTSTFDASNHYEEGIMLIQRFRPETVWTAILRDADQGNYPYVKRFKFEPSARRQRYLGENERSALIALSDKDGARFLVTFGGVDEIRGQLTLDAEDFIAVKSLRAKGKRLTTYEVASIIEIEPREKPDPENMAESDGEADSEADEDDASDAQSDDEVRDELTGQQRIF